jgi:hypothetical protein
MLRVGRTVGGAEYYGSSTGRSRSATVSGLPLDGSTIYANSAGGPAFPGSRGIIPTPPPVALRRRPRLQPQLQQHRRPQHRRRGRCDGPMGPPGAAQCRLPVLPSRSRLASPFSSTSALRR